MAETTSPLAVTMRIAVIAVVVLGIGEAVVVINRELWLYFPPWVEQLNALPFYAIWAIVALAYRVGWPMQATSAWGIRVSEIATRDRLVIALAGMLALSMYLGSIVTVLGGDARRAIGLDMISAALLGPVVEEWVFRGLVWNQVVTAMSGRRGAELVALFVSSVVFGLFHTAFEGHTWRALYQAVGHAEFGVLVGVMRWRSRSLAPGAIVHGVGNLFARLAMP
jgi:membrane protease YdiL (CAAX protease family)